MCVAGISIFIIIILIIIKYKYYEKFNFSVSKESNDKNITDFINSINGYQLDILKQSYEAYTKLYDYFPFLADAKDTDIPLTYENMKFLFTENATNDIKNEIAKIGSVKGYLGQLFLDLANEGIFYIEAMPYIGMYVLLILGVRKNMYQTGIDAFKMKYPVKDYDIVINDDYNTTGILTFYFNHTYCAGKEYTLAEFDDLVDDKNKNKIPKCSGNTTSPSTTPDKCCRSINVESLLNRLRSDAREWSTLTKTNIEGKMEFITVNMKKIGELLTTFIYMIVLYKNGTKYYMLDTDFNLDNIENKDEKMYFSSQLNRFNKLILSQSKEMQEFITNYVKNYNIHVSNCVPGLKVGKILNSIKQELIDLKKKNSAGKTKKDFMEILNMFTDIQDLATNGFNSYMNDITQMTSAINSKCNVGK